MPSALVQAQLLALMMTDVVAVARFLKHIIRVDPLTRKNAHVLTNTAVELYEQYIWPSAAICSVERAGHTLLL